MSDRETILQIRKIMKRLFLLPYGACNQIAPRKGTTRRECYRALWEIQELLGTRRLFCELPPQTNADKLRAMSDEELAKYMGDVKTWGGCPNHGARNCQEDCYKCWLDWLQREASDG